MWARTERKMQCICMRYCHGDQQILGWVIFCSARLRKHEEYLGIFRNVFCSILDSCFEIEKQTSQLLTYLVTVKSLWKAFSFMAAVKFELLWVRSSSHKRVRSSLVDLTCMSASINQHWWSTVSLNCLLLAAFLFQPGLQSSFLAVKKLDCPVPGSWDMWGAAERYRCL